MLPGREAIEGMGASPIPAAFTAAALAPLASRVSHQPVQQPLKHKQTPHLPQSSQRASGTQHGDFPVTGKGLAKPLGDCRVPSPLRATFLLVGLSPRWCASQTLSVNAGCCVLVLTDKCLTVVAVRTSKSYCNVTNIVVTEAALTPTMRVRERERQREGESGKDGRKRERD